MRTQRVLILFALLTCTARAEPPVFLDGWDSVTVWVPEAMSPAEATPEKFAFTLAGKPIAIAKVEPRESAAPRISADMLTLPGTLAGPAWDPASPAVTMTRTPSGTYQLILQLAPGNYEYKLARGGTWAQNWGRDFVPGGPNYRLTVPASQLVRFEANLTQNSLKNSLEHPSEVATPRELPPSTPETTQKFQSFRLRLAKPLTARQLPDAGWVQVNGGPRRPLAAREVLNHPSLTYTKTDLGPSYTPNATTFKVWSPASASVRLHFYSNASSPSQRFVTMARGAGGVWHATVKGNLVNRYYRYEFRRPGESRFAADIYAKAASPDSSRSAVVDIKATNPPGWPAKRPFTSTKPTDAILYEAHVRDLTVEPKSGIPAHLRGKYLGLTKTGTRVPGTTLSTGLDYLAELGVTHIHLLPFQDFNPAHSTGYNWGYETTLFNVPEEQYAVDKTAPGARIRELKQMVMMFQRKKLGVVLDVVYNHSVPSEGPGSAFWQAAPYYYFRTNDRGDVLNESGVGNALHDERPMVRKFIRDSLVFWAKEYRLDGFRFDLVGMFTPESAKDWSAAVRAVNPAALMYGEPWTGGGPTRLGIGQQKGTDMAVFNDRFRNLWRGELDGDSAGFGAGGSVDVAAFRDLLQGRSGNEFASPAESVNYVSAHDNLTLRDRLAKSVPASMLESAVTFSTAGVLLARGIPFLEGGVEMGRVKGGNHNSYNAGDPVNRFDWSKRATYLRTTEYVRRLIGLRRGHAGLRSSGAGGITFGAASPGVEIVRVAGEPNLLIVFNGTRQSATAALPAGGWRVAVAGFDMRSPVGARVGASVTVPPLNVLVLRGE